MTTVLLVRHGRTTANATGLLAGRTPGVHLDERGREQVERLGLGLAALPIDAVICSPLERTMETAAALLPGPKGIRPLHEEDGLIECGYGDWTGRELKVLAKDPLWKIVQSQPSAVKRVSRCSPCSIAPLRRSDDGTRHLDRAVCKSR